MTSTNPTPGPDHADPRTRVPTDGFSWSGLGEWPAGAAASSYEEKRARSALAKFGSTYFGGDRIRRLSAIVWSLFLAFCALMVGALFVMHEQRRLEELVDSPLSAGFTTAYIVVENLVVLSVPVVVLLRRRYPMAMAYGLGIAEILFGCGPVMAFVIPHLVRAGDVKHIRRAVALYGVGLLVGIPRDLSGRTTHTSVLRLLAGGSGDTGEIVPTPVAMTVLLAALSVAIPLGIGWYLRTRDALRGSQREAERQRAAVSEQRAHSGQLSQELTRAQEREIIAREVHDVMGRRLSIISLYAGGLEADPEADPELREAASLIKTTAQEAVADLRQLVSLMRDPSRALASSIKSIDDLDQMVARATQSGQKCSAFIRIDDPGRADRQVLYVVHRVIEELLTNAHKHASDTHFYLQVRGNASEGITIEGRNRADCAQASAGHGTGLRGIRQRVEEIGGRFSAECADGEFIVHIWIPFPLHRSS